MIRIEQNKANTDQLAGLILDILPEQGCIEVQHDGPGKLHDWHQHEFDETLIVVSGSMHFFWEKHELICYPGDVIHLPAGQKHGSRASDTGVIYLIAFRALDIHS